MDHNLVSKPTYTVVIDEVKHTTGVRHFVYPPRLPEEDVIELFKHELFEIVPVKLKELMERQDQVANKYDKRIALIEEKAKAKEIDLITEYFANYLSELDYMEYMIINRWLKYYIKLAMRAEPEGKWIMQMQQNPELDDVQLLRAREHLIEDLYEGRLRVNGQRLIGTCPFHEERTPSFVIFRDTNLFYCFGCHKHGDAIDFYMLKNKVDSLGDAIKALV